MQTSSRIAAAAFVVIAPFAAWYFRKTARLIVGHDDIWGRLAESKRTSDWLIWNFAELIDGLPLFIECIFSVIYFFIVGSIIKGAVSYRRIKDETGQTDR
jgi:hypothetical protein